MPHAAHILLLLLLSTAGVVRAQTGVIYGTVEDSRGEPLPGVNVYFQGSHIGAATSADGSFRIAAVPAGEWTLVASAVGFRQQRAHIAVPEDGSLRVDFVLQEIAIVSEEIVVTASRREQLAGSVSASISTLTPRDIEARNSVALDDALRYVPGVQMAGNQVNVRGSSGFSYNTGSRVLLLFDGMPMLRSDADGIPFDAIPMNQVRRIEVLKGPGSALYGGGALGGVINVITRDFPDVPETFVEGFAGAYEPARYETWRSKWVGADELRPFGGLTLGHARRLSATTGVWMNVSYRNDAGHLRLGKRENLQAYAKLGWRPSTAGRFSLLLGANRRKSDAFLFWNGARDALNPGRIDFGRNEPGSGSNDNLVTELSLLPAYSHVLSDRLSATAKGRLFGVLIQPLDENLKPKPVGQGTAGLRYGGEIQLSYSPNARRFVTAGLAGDANAARSSYFHERNAVTQPEGAAFLQWEEAVGAHLNLSAGARYDVYRLRAGVVQDKLSPKLGAALALNERLILRGAYGHGFRVPSVAERFVSNRDFLPIVMNLDLNPETSRSYEIGVRATPDIAFATRDLSLTLDAAAFWNDYWRLVEPTFVPAAQAFQFINLTRARIRGAEASLKVSAGQEKFSIEGGYTFLDTEDLTSQRPLVFRSKHLLKIGSSGRLGRLRMGVDYRYASKPERVDSDFALFIKDAHVMVPTLVLDARIGTSWRAVTATFHVKNALDYYYLERPAMLAPQRHFVLQATGRF